MESTENWRPIPGYEGYYEISDCGRLRTVERTDMRGQKRPSRIRRANVTTRGHHIAHLHRDRASTARPVAHWVLDVFVGPKPDGLEAIHLDGDKSNNAVTNLKWGRRTERVGQYDSQPCSIDGCARKSRVRGMCESHDRRSRLYGDPLASAPKKTLEERFWPRVEPTGFCWEWTAGHDGAGYGVFAVSKRVMDRAHRVAYELLVGPIPEGLVIDHLCRNRNCVNPDHLEPVTNEENIRRGFGPTRIRKKFGAKV